MASKEILTIESAEQWNAVLAQYRDLLAGDANLKEHQRTLTQVKSKLQGYMRKQLIDLNNEARQKKKQLKKSGGSKVEELGVDDAERKGLSGLIAFLISVDRDIPDEFFTTHGEELFNVAFKLTFYNDEQFAIANSPDLDEALKVATHDAVLSLVGQ